MRIVRRREISCRARRQEMERFRVYEIQRVVGWTLEILAKEGASFQGLSNHSRLKESRRGVWGDSGLRRFSPSRGEIASTV